MNFAFADPTSTAFKLLCIQDVIPILSEGGTLYELSGTRANLFELHESAKGQTMVSFSNAVRCILESM